MKRIEAGEFNTMAPKQEAASKVGADLASSFDGTAWVSGCTGWYTEGSDLPQTGPWAPKVFKDQLDEPEMADYDLK